MKNHTAEEKTNQLLAKSLLADIQGAPTAFLPRRDTLVDWLNAYLLRAARPGYVMDPTEADDLAELEKFIRAHDVPVAA
jgi:hypothetical protein